LDDEIKLNAKKARIVSQHSSKAVTLPFRKGKLGTIMRKEGMSGGFFFIPCCCELSANVGETKRAAVQTKHIRDPLKNQ